MIVIACYLLAVIQLNVARKSQPVRQKAIVDTTLRLASNVSAAAF